MIKYSLFGDRVSKRVFGMELLNVINSGKHFVKSGMEVSNIGGTKGLLFSVSDGEYYFNGSKVSFGVQNKQLTTPGVGKYKLTGLYVDASGVLTSVDGIVSNSLGGVKSPVINSATNFCIAVVLITGNAVGVNDASTIFDISVVNDYFSDIYMDSTMKTIAENNVDDVFELQTVFKNNTSYIPVDNPFTFRDWFVSIGGKNSSINTGNTTAVFDTDKYKLTFDSSTFYDNNIFYRDYKHSREIIGYSDLSPTMYINDLRILAQAAVHAISYYICSANFFIRLIYEDNSYWDTPEMYTFVLYQGSYNVTNYAFNVLELVHFRTKKVKRIETWSNTSLSNTGQNSIGVGWAYTPINDVIETKALSFDGIKTHTKLISNINTSETLPCPSGSYGNANLNFTGGTMGYDYFKYDLYDSLGNVQENLSLDTKNAISGLVGNPVKMVIRIVPPTHTGWWDNYSSYSNYENIPLLRQISGKPYINDFCLITYEE